MPPIEKPSMFDLLQAERLDEGDGVSAICSNVVGTRRKQVDILGFSIGGMVAQEITLQAPDLVRRLIVDGTGPRGGQGMELITQATGRSLVPTPTIRPRVSGSRSNSVRPRRASRRDGNS